MINRMRQEFIGAVQANRSIFGVELSHEKIERLADYFELLQQSNHLLHLIAPCSPEEFAIRHVLESLVLLSYLPENARFADIGTGGGLPSIPCLIVRDDLRAFLIETKEKKARFLMQTLDRLGLVDRARVVNRQFEEVKERDFSYVTCRALDRFADKLSRLIKWSGGRKLILFGGPSLAEALQSRKVHFEERLIPLSERRYVYVAN